jgi:hypothetical protein
MSVDGLKFVVLIFAHGVPSYWASCSCSGR